MLSLIIYMYYVLFFNLILETSAEALVSLRGKIIQDKEITPLA